MKKRLATLLAALLLVPTLAWAQAGGVELVSKVEAEVVVKNEKGEKVVQRVDARQANVAPGDAVIYTVSYRNTAPEPATNVAIKNPVPEHMVYVENSAEGAGTRIDFSVDGGASFAPAGKLTVRSADGKERPATAADVNIIRWTVDHPLAKGETGSVSFKARVK